MVVCTAVVSGVVLLVWSSYLLLVVVLRTVVVMEVGVADVVGTDEVAALVEPIVLSSIVVVVEGNNVLCDVAIEVVAPVVGFVAKVMVDGVIVFTSDTVVVASVVVGEVVVATRVTPVVVV